VWQQDIGVFPVHFQAQGDEWTHHLAVELTGGGHIGATGTDGTEPVVIGPPTPGPVTSKLHVTPHQDGIRCTVVGDQGTASQDQVDPWRRAAEAAVAALGHRNRDFTWEAIIGTDPVVLGMDRLGALGTARTLGPVRLTPGGICMRERVMPYDQRIDQSGFGVRHSFPVIAAGQVSTYDWERVEPVAENCLRRTCALLTLCSGPLWVPRSHPRQLIDGQDGLKIPAVAEPLPRIPGRPEETEWRGTISPETQFELPDWIESAWQALDADKGLARAVNAHYEAVRLDRGHPSVAHLIHVAAIEGFGTRFVDDARCDCHRECTHPKPVAGKRFRAALKTVMSNREVKQLATLAYDLRSITGHTGDLFGSEHAFGYPLMLLFQQTGDVIFDYAVLGKLRQATRRVLIKALQEACT
jgi:hypothetical protein